MSAPLQPLRPRGSNYGKPRDTEDPFGDVGTAQDYLREGVRGYGESLKPAILQDIGSTLGDLNSIGGLRSGGASVALGDLGTKYGAQIGAYAARATEHGLDAGLEAHRQRFAEAEAKRRRKAALLGAIGSVLGAGVSLIPGLGFAGKAAGAIAGGAGGGTRVDDPNQGGYA
jgi:hypothetical protein